MSDGRWYVSTEGTDDAAAGRGDTADDPWATVGYALGQINGGSGLQDGDIIYVAPGLYEGSAITLTQDGGSAPSSGSPAYIRGDPNLEHDWIAGVTPGRVIISGSSSGVPGASSVFDWGSTTYVEVWNCFITGSKNANGTCIGHDGNSGNVVRYCSIYGSFSATKYVTVLDCYCVGGESGVSYAEAPRGAYTKRTIALGFYAFKYSQCEQCFGIGGYAAFYGSFVNGCAQAGGQYSYENVRIASGSNIAFCGKEAVFSGAENMSDLFVFCNYYVANATENGHDQSSWRNLYGYFNTASTAAAAGHECFLADPKTAWRALTTAFRPAEFNDYDMEQTAAATATEGVMGLPIEVMSSSQTAAWIGPGPWAVGEVTHTYPSVGDHRIRVQKLGAEFAHIPVLKTVDLALSVSVTSANFSGTPTYPQIILMDEFGTALDTDIATTAEDVLSVSCTPTIDAILTLKMESRDTTVGHLTEFYNPTVT